MPSLRNSDAPVSIPKMTSARAPLGLRERTRLAVRHDISQAAMALFLERGFDATTIDQISQAVGISRRSFFRYFPSKEDIVLGDLAPLGQEIKTALEARPDHESPWEAMRAALGVLGRAYPPDVGLRISKMLLDTPSLRARRIEKRLQWQALLVPVIEKRLGLRPGRVPDPRAQAIVTCALACLDVATETWTRRNGKGNIETIFDQAAQAIRG